VRDADRAPPARHEVTDLIERGWDTLSRWAVPVMMTLAYAFLAATAETSTSGKLWMAAGLGLVLIAWFAFRALAGSAALSRALAVGDTARLFELSGQGLARRRRPAARARFLVARGLARLLRGEFAAALTALEAARPAPDLAPLATALGIAARVELDRPAEGLTVRAPRAPWLAWLAEGMLAWRRAELDAAAPLLLRVTGDIRAGSALRAIAHVYAARIAEARSDRSDAARHRAAAANLADADAAWLRGETCPIRSGRARRPRDRRRSARGRWRAFGRRARLTSCAAR
jgi:hypothetical protein